MRFLSKGDYWLFFVKTYSMFPFITFLTVFFFLLLFFDTSISVGLMLLRFLNRF